MRYYIQLYDLFQLSKNMLLISSTPSVKGHIKYTNEK